MGWVKKLWHFLWDEDSFASWVANVVIAFVLIKFVLYPIIGFFFGTSFPIVAVISGSMEHDGSFDQWWTTPDCKGKDGYVSQEGIYKDYNISQDIFLTYNFKNGFNKGDIMILFGVGSPKVGDVIVFMASTGDPIIHRVVISSKTTVKTKGDHNCGSSYFEDSIDHKSIIGRAVLRVPLLGWVKIGFVELLRLIGIG